jgi:hypothetical protein
LARLAGAAVAFVVLAVAVEALHPESRPAQAVVLTASIAIGGVASEHVLNWLRRR